MEEGRLPRVSESVLKKRRRNLNAQALKDRQLAKKSKGKRFVKKTLFKRAERFVKENKKAERNDTRLVREQKKPEKCQVKPKGDLAFVLRIRGKKDVPKKANTIMGLLRLTNQEDGVFLKLNKTTLSLLQIVEPYVTWGHPNLKIVRDLIYKKGSGRFKGKRLTLADNKNIELALGKHDIICLEDLIHEIFNCDGENFTAVNDFLYKFNVNRPVGGWKGKSKPFKDGGDFGCRHDKINALLQSLI